jgi:hypothetical protein
MQLALVLLLSILGILPIAGSLDLLGIAVIQYLAVYGAM